MSGQFQGKEAETNAPLRGVPFSGTKRGDQTGRKQAHPPVGKKGPRHRGKRETIWLIKKDVRRISKNEG